jgi:serine/threonine protein phosphatase 1
LLAVSRLWGHKRMQPFYTYVIGDIHGCHREARSLFAACTDYNDDRQCCFIFLGDYMDRGPESRAAGEWLMDMEAMMPDQVLCLRGNHEDLLVSAARGSKEDENNWIEAGGGATLASYGVAHASEIQAAHVKWLSERPLLFRDGRRLYVHAGIIPGVPLNQQPRQALLWIRDEFLSSDADHGFLVVHGHTPLETSYPDLRPNRLNLDTGACFGGPLSAAVFCDAITEPLAFINDSGIVIALRENQLEYDP